MFSRQVARWRTVAILMSSTLSLATGGYLLLRGTYASFPCIYYAIAGVFTLLHEGREKDMRPCLFDLPQWLLFTSITVFGCFMLSVYFLGGSTLFSITFFVLASFFLFALGYVGIKISETRPKTAEAETVSWVLKMSSNRNPAWFKMAVQIAGKSPNVRALLLQKLLPLLVPLITSGDGREGVTDERKGYINTLAKLMDFTPRKKSFWRNKASLERPQLPKELIDRLRQLRASGRECTHRLSKDNNEEKWNDGSVRCPKACVSDTVCHILQLYESDVGEEETENEIG